MDRPVESDSDSLSDFGSDFEAEQWPKKRKAKSSAQGVPPRKQPLRMVNNHSPHAGRTRDGMPHGVRVGHGKARSLVPTGHLYEAMRSGKIAVVTVVDEWLESYKQDKEAGLLELINFIVQCCGCKGVVTMEMFRNMQNAEIISRLTKDFNEDSVSYPLSSSSASCRRFRSCLSEFLHLLVRRCQNSLLYDEYLLPSVLAVLTGLSDSQVRAFRHTSTLMAMKLTTALTEVAVEVSVQMETTRRRFEAERSKEPEHRAQQRLEQLHSSCKKLLEQQEELQSMMNAAFKGVFVHRYRDRVPEIRVVCIEELGEWLRGNPSTFLNDGYLKYLGWTLHDKQASVRRRCVQALQGVYRNKEFAGRLELFTSRFKGRMLSMTLDKDSDVAVEVVVLLLLIYQNTEDCLCEEDCERLYPLVFATHRGLACAAGNFLYHRLRFEENKENQETANHRANFLHLLVCFFVHSEFHDHAAYLVDSLWDCAGSELKDWEIMTSQLLQENGESPELNDKEEGALIELMMSAMRQASEGHPPVGRAPVRKVVSTKAQKIQAQNVRRLTNHFVLVLPQLLAKYSADVQKVTALLRAPLYFNLEIYSSNQRLEKYLELLLVQLCGIVEKHHDSGVLEACARVANALCADKYTFSTRADLVVSQLLDSLLDRFTSSLDDVLQDTADEDEMYGVVTTLKRIAVFSSAKDLSDQQLFKPCLRILRFGVESRELPSELMVPALKCAGFHLLWENVRITKCSPTKAALKQLKQEVQGLFSVCQSCLSVREAELRDEAFLWLCDLLVVFSTNITHRNPTLQTLACPPSETLCAEMASFLMDYVFMEPQNRPQGQEQVEDLEEIVALQRCRIQLAGYCKLVIFNVLDLSAASDIFKNYNKFYKDYGDIMKEMLSKTKAVSPVQTAKTLCLSLQQMYAELPWELGEDGVRSSEDFGDMRGLARRLVMTFGVDLHRVRKPLMSLHEFGIQFSIQGIEGTDKPPRNLLFLEVLSEFSFKLLRQDRTQILDLLKSQVPVALSNCPSVRLYKRSLQAGTRASLMATPTPKRRRTEEGSAISRKDSVSREKQWLEASHVSSVLASPPLTSTMLMGQSSRKRVPGEVLGTDLSTDEEALDLGTENSLLKQDPIRQLQRPASLAPNTSSSNGDLSSNLDLLSLIEEEYKEPEAGDFSSEDSDTAVALPSSRYSTSLLEELFN